MNSMVAKFAKFIVSIFALLTLCYYWVAHANGVVHFSDKPHSGPKKLEISEPQVCLSHPQIKSVSR